MQVLIYIIDCLLLFAIFFALGKKLYELVFCSSDVHRWCWMFHSGGAASHGHLTATKIVHPSTRHENQTCYFNIPEPETTIKIKMKFA